MIKRKPLELSPGLDLQLVEVPTPNAIEPVFSRIAQEGFDGAVVTGAMMTDQRVRVGAAALAHKIPVMAGNVPAVPHGLLMSYGARFPRI